MAFWANGVNVLRTVVCAGGMAWAIFGLIIFFIGLGEGNPGKKGQGLWFTIAGGGVFVVGLTLVPLLSNAFN